MEFYPSTSLSFFTTASTSDFLPSALLSYIFSPVDILKRNKCHAQKNLMLKPMANPKAMH